jgi:hypothetical protein
MTMIEIVIPWMLNLTTHPCSVGWLPRLTKMSSYFKDCNFRLSRLQFQEMCNFEIWNTIQHTDRLPTRFPSLRTEPTTLEHHRVLCRNALFRAFFLLPQCGLCGSHTEKHRSGQSQPDRSTPRTCHPFASLS